MKLFEPIDGNFADVTTGVVLLNQVGATVSQDAGRDAQVLANTFNLPVIAVDRPGTGGLIPHRQLARELSTPVGYLVAMAELGKDIDRQAESLGLGNLVAMGRSAGGLGALALARTETVSSINAVFAAEPVGCEQLPLDEGKKRYLDYLKQQKGWIADTPDEGLVKPQPPGLPLLPAVGRILSMGPAMLVDRYHNQHLFATDAALHYAAYIAQKLPLIDTTLEFAERSMVASPTVYDRDISPLPTLRSGGAPFEVRQPKGTVHASFDNRDYMSQVIEPTIDRTLARAA